MSESSAQKKVTKLASKKSVAGKMAENRRKKEAAIRAIFDDNSTGRPDHPDGD